MTYAPEIEATLQQSCRKCSRYISSNVEKHREQCAPNRLSSQNSIFIECRMWYDKTWGNSYFSYRLWVDGQMITAESMSYGYENAYQLAAIERMIVLGYLPEITGAGNQARQTRELPLYQVNHFYGVIIYTSQNYGLKKDLFAEYPIM